MLDDELTLLDGTEVISASLVTKITAGCVNGVDLVTQLSPVAILDGIWYFDRFEVEQLVAAAR